MGQGPDRGWLDRKFSQAPSSSSRLSRNDQKLDTRSTDTRLLLYFLPWKVAATWQNTAISERETSSERS